MSLKMFLGNKPNLINIISIENLPTNALLRLLFFKRQHIKCGVGYNVAVVSYANIIFDLCIIAHKIICIIPHTDNKIMDGSTSNLSTANLQYIRIGSTSNTNSYVTVCGG